MTTIDIPEDLDLDVPTLHGYMASVWDEDHPARKTGFPVCVQVTQRQFDAVSSAFNPNDIDRIYGMQVKVRGS